MIDYNKIAEFIVQNAPGIVPEYVGEQLAEAEADIFTWLKGTERTEALKKRAAARNWLKETARRLGYPGELEPEELVLGEEMVEVKIGERPERHYWEVTNMTVGEIMVPIGPPFLTIQSAVVDAKFTMDTDFRHFGDDHLVIKIFDKSPDERAGVTYEPEYTESYWVEKTETTSVTGRPFPKTYGDWVNLAESIKEKMPRDAWGIVNDLLQTISEGGPVAEEAKRWLMQKAGELGIK